MGCGSSSTRIWPRTKNSQQRMVLPLPLPSRTETAFPQVGEPIANILLTKPEHMRRAVVDNPVVAFNHQRARTPSPHQRTPSLSRREGRSSHTATRQGSCKPRRGGFPREAGH